MENQEQLDYYKKLIDATIDYSIETFELHDNPDFETFRQETSDYYNQGNLEVLMQWFDDLIEPMLDNTDLEFIDYLKEVTGFDVNIYEKLEAEVDELLKQKEIKTGDEYESACMTFDYWIETKPKDKKTAELSSLIMNYENLFDLD